MKRIASILLLFLPLLAAAQGRGLNERITNDLSRLPAMDAVVDSFMNVWSLRGVSLSVMRNDSLVYARGYGRADASRPMTPGTLLRIASVSKLITAVGIMKLQERGKLVLDTPVFGPFGVLDGYDEYITDDNYYTFGAWGVASNYDLCIDSSILGIDGTADYIIDFGRRAGRIR